MNKRRYTPVRRYCVCKAIVYTKNRKSKVVYLSSSESESEILDTKSQALSSSSPSKNDIQATPSKNDIQAKDIRATEDLTSQEKISETSTKIESDIPIVFTSKDADLPTIHSNNKRRKLRTNLNL